jgi:hypothetical protein
VGDDTKSKFKSGAATAAGAVAGYAAAKGSIKVGVPALKKSRYTHTRRTELDSDLVEKVRKHVSPNFRGTISVDDLDGSSYNPFTNHVSTGRDLGSLAHGLGHSTNKTLHNAAVRKAGAYSRYFIGHVLGRNGVAAAALLGAYEGGNKSKKPSKLALAAGGTVGLAGGAMLGQEAYASLKGHAGLAKMLGSHKEAFKHTRSLVPALGTYALAASLPFLAYGVAKTVRKHLDKQASTEEHRLRNTATAGVVGGLGAVGMVAGAGIGAEKLADKMAVGTEIDKDLEANVRKHVAPKFKGRILLSHRMRPGYNSRNKKAYSNHDLGSLAHELGHSTDRTLRGRVGASSRFIREVPFTMSNSPKAALIAAALGAHDGGRKDGKSSTVAKVGAGVLGASSGLILGQEAYASAKGHHGLSKMLGSHKEAFKHTKSLIPSFGSYAAVAAMPYLAYGLSKKLRKHFDKQASSSSYYDQNDPNDQSSPWKAKAALAAAGLAGGALFAHRASKLQINKDKFDEAIKHHDEAWDFIKGLNAKGAMNAPDAQEKAKYHYNRLQQNEQLFGAMKDAPYKGVMHSARKTSSSMGKFLLAKKFPNIHKI